MSKVRNRSFHDVLEGDYLEPVRELKQERDKLEEALVKIRERILENRIMFSNEEFFKIVDIADEALEEVDNHE